MNNLLNKYEALEAALDQTGLNSEYVRLISCSLCGSYYAIELRSDWMWYECMVGAVSGSLMGLNYEPSVDVEALDGVNCAELLDDVAASVA